MGKDEMESLKKEMENVVDLKLAPIQVVIEQLAETIERMEKSQEKVVELLVAQASQSEKLKYLDEELKQNDKAHDTLFKRIREVENNAQGIERAGNKRMWDFLKLLLTGLMSGGVTIAVSHFVQ